MRYEIGDKIYLQRPIVLGQFNCLLPLIKGWPLTQKMGPWEIVQSAGKELPKALAVILIEEGVNIKDAVDSLDARATEIEFAISPEQTLQVIDDFFGCNQLSVFREKLTGTLGKVVTEIHKAYTFRQSSSGSLPGKIPNQSSNGSVSSSPKKTSLNESRSSGKSKRKRR